MVKHFLSLIMYVLHVSRENKKGKTVEASLCNEKKLLKYLFLSLDKMQTFYLKLHKQKKY